MLTRFSLRKHAANRFSLLSQGEKTRVLLARAYLSAPELIVMDEPCSGLDIRGREELLQSIVQGLTQPEPIPVVYVTHHADEIMPGFTHVLLLKEGRIFRSGPKSEVLQSETLSAAFDVPVTVEMVYNRPFVRVLPSSAIDSGEAAPS